VFVVEQQDCVKWMVQSPLLFEEMDTLDLAGLGIGDEGAAGMAKTLSLNPNLRRCILSDNKIGEEGGAALAASLAVNTCLQVGPLRKGWGVAGLVLPTMCPPFSRCLLVAGFGCCSSILGTPDTRPMSQCRSQML
jgi:hypothetical protein